MKFLPILPENADIGKYRNLIQSWPIVDSFKSIGLPANIDRAYQLNRGAEIVERLNFMHKAILFDGNVISSSGKTNWATSILPLVNLWKKVCGCLHSYTA